MTVKLGSESITVVHYPLATNARDGSQYRDLTNPERTTYTNCMVQPFLMSNKLIHEDQQSREWTQEFLRVYLPSGAVITYVDTMEWRGRLMEAFGEPQEWFDRKGRSHHIQVIGLIKKG